MRFRRETHCKIVPDRMLIMYKIVHIFSRIFTVIFILFDTIISFFAFEGTEKHFCNF